jgi:type II secretory pathway predicted ATPase ExeA
MELSRSCKEYWGFQPFTVPFGKHLQAEEGLFLWPEFEDVVGRIVRAVEYRRFLVVVGAACSSKSTAWQEARRRVLRKEVAVHVCEPRALEPSEYDEQTIYRSIHRALVFGGRPPEQAGLTEKERQGLALRHSREERAYQCRRLLEAANVGGRPVVFTVNDCHHCRMEFLLLCKRLWDDLYGFDRLLAVILVGQPSILTQIARSHEISERADVLRMPGLGRHVGAYVAHECARCGRAESPLDDSAVETLERLATTEWTESLDHPLIVNNIVSRALELGKKVKARRVSKDLVQEAMKVERRFGLDGERQ